MIILACDNFVLQTILLQKNICKNMTWWFSTTDLFVIKKKKNIALVVMLWCLTGNGEQLTTAPEPGMTFQLFLYWQKKEKLTF